MSLPTQLNAALAGRYEIEREIGKGGMATVYLARDLKHGRRVALKLLDPELGAVLGADRFLSEIRVTANLQHPNLLPLFDSGEANGMLFYVMPFIEGESLRARLDREKQLPIDEAVRIATAVASALDYAHRHAVIHRDLKPENILLNDGQPLIADFGIALAVSNAGGARVTQTGLSLGTPQYMSPEQATGDRGIDGRTDIYSLGAVTYEMLCGEPPHHGNTAQAIIAKLMTEEPRPLTTLRRTVPPHVDDAVRCALEKLPADRFATAKEFCDALVGARPSPTIRTPAAKQAKRPTLALLVAPWIIAAGAVAFAAFDRPDPPPDLPTTRTWIDLPAQARLDIQPFIAVDRQGRFVVFRASLNRVNQLFIRSLDDPQAKPIPGTTDGYVPFLSPDGAWIGYATSERVVKVPISGGTPVTIARIPPNAAPACAWGLDEVIVCGSAQGLRKISAAGGGTFTQITSVDTSLGETGHRTPRFLADGRTLVFTAFRGAEPQLAFARLDGTVLRTGITGGNASAVGDDIMLYTSGDGVLYATRFDPASLTTVGQSVPVAEGLTRTATGLTFWSVSPNGTLAYAGGATLRRLVRVSRSGAMVPLIDEPRSFRRPIISPDGSRIILETTLPVDIWVYSLAGKTLSRLGSPEGSTDPLWTPDGKRILYTVPAGSGSRSLEWRNADGTGASERLITATAGNLFAMDWTDGGRTLIYDESPRGRPATILAFDMAARTSRLVIESHATVRLPSMSPDGKWIAYESLENGQREIFVSAYPGPGGRSQVSDRGGAEPIWSRDGREIFYRAPRSMMSAIVDVRNGTFAVKERRVLFEDNFVVAGTLMYSVFPDGQSFAMMQSAEADRQLALISNIGPELRAKLGMTKK